MSEWLLVWHFVDGDRRLFRNGGHHGRAKKIRKNQTLHVEPPLTMCKRGLHGSVLPLDALEYVPRGHLGRIVVCRCEVWGEMERQSDKVCAEYRKALWWADCTTALHEFACDEAERALALTDNPDPRSIAAITTKRRWLCGEATDAERAAARDAAWDAAWAAAWDAARAAAWAAARAAAWDAARDAAWAAARDAARDAARAAQNERLAARLEALHKEDK